MNTEIIAETSSQNILIKRRFEAKKQQVYRLFVEKDLQVQWQTAFLFNFKFLHFDCTPGGSYHSAHSGADGRTYGFRGIYHELIPNECIIKTSEFIGLPFKVLPSLEVLNFEEYEGQTQLTIQIICDSIKTRDAMLQHGMQTHFDAIFGAMDELVKNKINPAN